MTPNDFPTSWPITLPDGNGGWRPAPLVLTEAEAISVLRLDEPDGPIRRYRDLRLLRGCTIGNVIRYPLGEVLRVLAVKTAAGTAAGS